MPYLYNLPNATSGLDTIVVQTVTAVPAFTSLILVFVFVVVFLGGILRQKARNLQADAPMWAVIASLGTFMVAMIMSLTTGIIRLDWVIIVLSVTILSGVWFFLDRKQGENV